MAEEPTPDCPLCECPLLPGERVTYIPGTGGTIMHCAGCWIRQKSKYFREPEHWAAYQQWHAKECDPDTTWRFGTDPAPEPA